MRLRGGKGDGQAGGQRVRKGRVAGERDMRREGAGIGGEIRLRKRADRMETRNRDKEKGKR